MLGPPLLSVLLEQEGAKVSSKTMKITSFFYLLVLILVIPPLLENNSEITLRPTKHNQLGKRSAWDSEYKFKIILPSGT